MFEKIIWPMIIILSISLSFVFIIGFATSINISNPSKEDLMDIADNEKDILNSNDKMEDKENMKDNKINRSSNFKILILGDSLGFGMGDNDNLGFAKRYEALLNQEKEKTTELTNLSVPGFESDQLLELIDNQENDDFIRESDLIIISIGGNDLNRVKSGDNLSMDRVFREILEIYKENLRSTINKIRVLNPDVKLAIIGLYDPTEKEAPEKTSLLLEWNYQTRLIVNDDFEIFYVPTHEQFKYHIDEYLSEDIFHPNAKGYQIIAEELYRILNGSLRKE